MKQPKKTAPKQLSQADQKKLDSLFLIAQDYLDNFVEAGLVLAEIKELGGYSTKEWDAACKAKLVIEGKPLSGSYADQIIAAAKQHERLHANGMKGPANERQARALRKLPEDLQGQAMEALEAAGEPATAARIEELAKKANNGTDPAEVIRQSKEAAKAQARQRSQDNEQTREEKLLAGLRRKLDTLRVQPVGIVRQARSAANKLVGIVDSDRLEPVLERLGAAADELTNAAAECLDVLKEWNAEAAEAPLEPG